MKIRIFVLIITIVCCQFFALSQTKEKREFYRSVSLRRLAYNANYGTLNKLKLKNVVLRDFRNSRDEWKSRENWIYVFHLKDSETGFEIGKELTPYTKSFLICTDDIVGKPLINQKEEWLNRKVNLYIQPRDVGLTPLMNVGFVTKIELLGSNGKVVKTIE